MEAEIMTNEELIERTEEVAKAMFNRDLKMFGTGAVTVIVSVVTYKYVIKPGINKFKVKRAEKKVADTVLSEEEAKHVRDFKVVENDEI